MNQKSYIPLLQLFSYVLCSFRISFPNMGSGTECDYIINKDKAFLIYHVEADLAQAEMC